MLTSVYGHKVFHWLLNPSHFLPEIEPNFLEKDHKTECHSPLCNARPLTISIILFWRLFIHKSLTSHLLTLKAVMHVISQCTFKETIYNARSLRLAATHIDNAFFLMNTNTLSFTLHLILF